MNKICEYCGKIFSVKPSHFQERKNCSKDCYSKMLSIKAKGKNNPNFKNSGWKICKYCNKEFKSYNKTRIYCSTTCANLDSRTIDRNNPPLCKCGCGGFVIWNDILRRWDLYIVGHKTRRKPLPKNVITKYSNNNQRRRIITCKKCKKQFVWHTIRTYCPDCTKVNNLPNTVCKICGKEFYPKNNKVTCSKECSRKWRSIRQKGSKSHRWQNGKTTESMIIRGSLDYAIWRDTVFKRDNYTCQICGKTGGRLSAHHIKPFSENEDLRLDINNGITLCRHPCHSSIRGKESEYEVEFMQQVARRGGLVAVVDSADWQPPDNWL